MPRMAQAIAFSVTSGKTYRLHLDLNAQTAVKVEHVRDRQPPFSPEDYENCEAVVRGHEGFRQAIAKAGYDADKVMIDPWSVGYFGEKEHPRNRLAWALMYYKVRSRRRREREGVEIERDD